MTILGFRQDQEPERPVESAQRRAARLDIERAMLEVATADPEEGHRLSGDELDAWLDAWERGSSA